MKRIAAPTFLTSSLVSLAGFCIGSADAADWQWDPEVILSGNYNTNYGLDSLGAQNISVAGTSVDASMHASLLDPTTRFEITPRVRTVYYPGQTEFDANDAYVNSQFQQSWQRANFTLTGIFWSQDILQSFLPTTNVGTPLGQNSPGGDLAVVNERVRQDLLILTPSASFDLSPRETLEIQAGYLGVDYSQAVANQAENFKNYSGSVGLGFAVTAQSTVTVRVNGSDLRPESGSTANTYGGEGEWRTHLSEVMQAYAKLGLEHTSFGTVQAASVTAGSPMTSVSGGSPVTSVSGGFGISRKFFAYDLFADFSRSVSPDSVGAVVARDDLRVRLEHKFSARTSGYVGLRGINQTALGNSAGFAAQRYGQAALGFEWRIFRQFSVISQYAYTTLKDANVGQAAGSNAVTISLDYQPHRPPQETGVRIGY
jgi:hypothetical protein